MECIAITRAAFENLSKILTSSNLNIKLNLRIAQCYIWPILLYGTETWILTKTTLNKLEAFEMWLYRKMLRAS